MKTTSPVVIIYEDNEAREAAVKFCDRLIERFWSRCEFDLTWLSLSNFDDEALLQAATDKSALAALMIFAFLPGREIPLEVRAWIEKWLAQRGDREGAIIALEYSQATPSGIVSPHHVYLRSIAHRAGMDYLTQMPETLNHAAPESRNSISDRAHQVTSVLDQIIRKKQPPRDPLAP